MTFQDSVKTCFSKYVDFSGRASRSEYWWFVLFIVIGDLVTRLLGHGLPLVFILLTLLPSIAVATRRLHDTDRSGWLQLIVLIPLLGALAMIYFLVQDPRDPNRFGPEPGDDESAGQLVG